MKMNGWCISFIGHKNEIQFGYYTNNMRNGDWMCLNATDMSIKENATFENN